MRNKSPLDPDGVRFKPILDNDTVAQDDTVLYASGQEANDDMTDIKPTGPNAWRGVLTVEGIESGDGRMFAPNSLSWADLPLPLRWQKESAHGGQNDVTVQVGNIDKIWREPADDGSQRFMIMGEGTIDLANPDGREVYRRMKNRYMRGNSVDVDSVKGSDIEYTYPQSVESPVATDGETESAGASFLDMMAQPELTTYKKGRIRATTLVEIPAFTEAKLALVNIDPVTTADADTEATVESQDDEEVETPVTDSVMETIVAATSVIEIADAPPREWFNEPTDVTALGALTVTAEGRVYGYIAPAGVRHRSFRDRVVNVPLKKVDYSRFMGGETIVADGGRVSTGSITMGCGHASTTANLNGQQAAEHYDNSCSIVATVRVGENEHGVWMAGALLPDIDSAQLRRIMACRLSGDWRGHLDKPGWREFVAALLVPVPGFPMARTAPSVSMTEGQLVASSVPVQLVAADMLFKPKSKKDDDDDGDKETDEVEKTADDTDNADADDDDDEDKNKKRVGAAALRVRALRVKSRRAEFGGSVESKNSRVDALKARVRGGE